MPRKPYLPKPWQNRRRNGDWYVTLPLGQGKQKQYYLAPAGATPDAVQNELTLLLTQAGAETQREQGAVVSFLERYLDYVERHRAAETYRMRKKDLQSFLKYLEDSGRPLLAVVELRPFHVSQWLDQNPAWNPSSRRIAINSLIGALNWAKKEGYIDSHPLERRITRPPRRSRGREVYMDEAIYREWLGFCRHKEQKYLLMAMWHTGCRPDEICSLGQAEGTRFDESRGLWVVRGKKTKASPSGLRTVGLTPLMIKLSRQLKEVHPTGALFRNCSGNPWYVHLVGQMFRRFRRRSAKLHPERAADFAKLVPYGTRHTWASNRLREGYSDALVARQLGHQGTTILHEHYNHILTEEVLPMVQSLKTLDEEVL